MYLLEEKVSINIGILLVVEEMQNYLESEFKIEATQQDIIENAIISLQIDLLNNYIVFE